MNKNSRSIHMYMFMFLVLTPLFFPLAAQAAAPTTVNYQGKLFDSSGNPITGSVNIDFSIYDALTGGILLWTESQTGISVVNGLFNTQLGSVTPLLQSYIAGGSAWLEIAVNSDPPMAPRQEIASVIYALHADTAVFAADADTVDGKHASDLEESLEIVAAVAAHKNLASDHHAKTTDFAELVSGQALDAQIAAEIARDTEIMPTVRANDGSGSGLDADTLDGQDSGSFAGSGHNHDAVYFTQAQVNALLAAQDARIAALETLLTHFSRSGSDITITGANLHVVSGSGATDGTVNGLGNLIVGYNELRGSGDARTGSHNIVVGKMHNFSSYGGLAAGFYNTISGIYASVSGGSYNTASGIYSSVSGGSSNTAAGYSSSVSGGRFNTASGNQSSVSGGFFNTASGNDSSVSGGSNRFIRLEGRDTV